MYGAPGEIRTPDRSVRSRVLYPAELQAHSLCVGAQLSVFVPIASNDGPAVIINGGERGITPGFLPYPPFGAALRAFKFAPGKFVEPKSSNQILNLHYLLMNGENPFIRRWRRARDSNPRYGSPYTPLAGVRLQPLGQLS